MKYRHAFHAGNFADVAKHVALVAALERLAAKERPLFLLETHAGRGGYALDGPAAGEAAGGILRLAARPARGMPHAVGRYLAIVRDFQDAPGTAIRRYPGSPLIAAALLRAQDRAAFCEILPAEAMQLRRRFRDDARASVHCRDGFEALGALLPPREGRGLVLIDPPYEETAEDFERTAAALVATATRWPQGMLMAWYPIKRGEVAARFRHRLVAAGLRRLLAAELCIHPDDSHAGLNGSGLAIVNAPWRLDDALRDAYVWLHAALAGAGRAQVFELAGE